MIRLASMTVLALATAALIPGVSFAQKNPTSIDQAQRIILAETAQWSMFHPGRTSDGGCRTDLTRDVYGSPGQTEPAVFDWRHVSAMPYFHTGSLEVVIPQQPKNGQFDLHFADLTQLKTQERAANFYLAADYLVRACNPALVAATVQRDPGFARPTIGETTKTQAFGVVQAVLAKSYLVLLGENGEPLKVPGGKIRLLASNAGACTSRFAVDIPAFNEAGKAYPARTIPGVEIKWSRIVRVASGDRATLLRTVFTPSYETSETSSGLLIVSPTENDAAQLAAATDWLRRICAFEQPLGKTQGVRGGDKFGRECELRHTPQLTLSLADQRGYPPGSELAKYPEAQYTVGERTNPLDTQMSIKFVVANEYVRSRPANWLGKYWTQTVFYVSRVNHRSKSYHATLEFGSGVEGKFTPYPDPITFLVLGTSERGVLRVQADGESATKIASLAQWIFAYRLKIFNAEGQLLSVSDFDVETFGSARRDVEATRWSCVFGM